MSQVSSTMRAFASGVLLAVPLSSQVALVRPRNQIFGNTVVREQHWDAWRKGLDYLTLLLGRYSKAARGHRMPSSVHHNLGESRKKERMVIQHEESAINLDHVLYGVRFRTAVLLSSSPSPLAPLLCAPLLSAPPQQHGDSRSVARFAENRAGALGAFMPNFGHMPLVLF